MVRWFLWNIRARSDVDISYSLLIHLSIDCGVFSRILHSSYILSLPAAPCDRFYNQYRSGFQGTERSIRGTQEDQDDR